MKYTTLCTIGFVWVGLAVAACSSDSSDGTGSNSSGGATSGGATSGGATSSSGSSSAEGVTACGNNLREDVKCQAGQYCEDQTLSICSEGCLSNTNCASDQACIKESGENLGSCQQKAAPSSSSGGGGGVSQATFCAKAQACNTAITNEQCAQLFTATNEECHQCVADSNCGAGCDAKCGVPN